ncbi:hypothetical protein NDU88_003469 [Pleurodeles waltl]|uniref:Uncharacterized protein n=1 Tax=Pleurodeles waltl TaxID=8319 RepID=A0AAV7M3H0_PLEWA|nr:hypothetical protein NDU88_003469 [Pleurodeles waltl]
MWHARPRDDFRDWLLRGPLQLSIAHERHLTGFISGTIALNKGRHRWGCCLWLRCMGSPPSAHGLVEMHATRMFANSLGYGPDAQIIHCPC